MLRVVVHRQLRLPPTRRTQLLRAPSAPENDAHHVVLDVRTKQEEVAGKHNVCVLIIWLCSLLRVLLTNKFWQEFSRQIFPPMAILPAVVCVLVGIAHAASATMSGHPQLRLQAVAPKPNSALAAQCSVFALLPGNTVAPLRGGGDDGEAQVQQGYDEIPVHVLTDMGREAIGEKKYGEAADYFSAALGRNVDKYGELATECAELYYLYGSALALEAEETDDNLFGPSVPARLPVEQVLIT